MPLDTVQDIEQKVIEILAVISKRPKESIQLNDSLVDSLKVDSIQFLELLAELEDKFSFEMEVDDLRPELFRSVQAVIHFVKSRVGHL